MAIIYSYPKVTSPLATDVLVLTDTTLTAGKRKNKTKSLSMSDLAAYVVSSTSGITGSGTLNTIPLFTPSGVKLGDSIITQAASGQGVTVTGQLDVTQDFNVTGDAILGTAEVTGSTQLNGTLTVDGVATFNGEVECNNNVTVQGIFQADGNSVFNGTLTVQGAFTAKVDGNTFNAYTSTSTQAGANALNPIQLQQALTADTLAELCVDPDGNIVRGSQEATWTFTNAQLNALTNTRVNLLSAPGAGKCIVVEESNWFMISDPNSTLGSFGSDLVCEMTGITVNNIATQMVKARMEEISVPAFGGLGIYSRDVPELNRDYRFNVPMTIRAKTASNQFPARCTSIALKIKYRLFDKDTF
jgi:hypothetical protein